MIGAFRIGSLELKNRAIAAPMAGVTDAACRFIASKYGAALTVTEMVSSKGIIHGDRKTLSLMKNHPDARPYAVQLFGYNENDLGEAARMVQDSGADIVDLNLGCPVRKIVRSGCGGALLKDLPLIKRIIFEMRKRISVPFTIKIRSGWDNKSFIAVELAKMAGDEGVDAITIHPRFVSEGFSGRAQWDIIGQVVAATRAPVIGNGDITNADDAMKMMRESGCEAVMIGRGAMGNPFIYREIAAAIAGEAPPATPTPEERCAAAIEQFDMMFDYLPPRVAVWHWRKHLCWYSRGLPNATDLRRVVFATEDPGALKNLAVQFFQGHSRGAWPCAPASIEDGQQ